MTKLHYLLTSRKFWAAVVGLALVIIRAYSPQFPLQEDELTRILAVLVAYILGTAVEDGLGARTS